MLIRVEQLFWFVSAGGIQSSHVDSLQLRGDIRFLLDVHYWQKFLYFTVRGEQVEPYSCRFVDSVEDRLGSAGDDGWRFSLVDFIRREGEAQVNVHLLDAWSTLDDIHICHSLRAV